MIALDTNQLARLLLRDDAAQHARVKSLLQTEQLFTAPVTVLLELVWVLEANDCTPADIEHGLKLLLALPNFKPPQADAVRAALHVTVPWTSPSSATTKTRFSPCLTAARTRAAR